VDHILKLRKCYWGKDKAHQLDPDVPYFEENISPMTVADDPAIAA